MAKRPTLKDVSLSAGVSQITASRTMRDPDKVSDKTRRIVNEAAKKLGYVPNQIAGALASQRVNLVGVVFPSFSSFVFPEILSGLSSALDPCNLQPVVGVSSYDLDIEERVIREMLSWRPSGLIIAGLEHSDASRKMLQSVDIPVVEVLDIDGDPIDVCVGISHRRAGRMMAEEFVSRGYRRIAFVGTKMQQDHRVQKRLLGFVEHLMEYGLQVHSQTLVTGRSSIAKGRELTKAMLEETPDVDCIYYSSDVMAVGGLMHCIADGLSVPGDLAIAGFNNLDILDGLPINLATTSAHRFEIGKLAAEVIIRRGEITSANEKKVIELEPTIRVGESL